MKPVIALTLVFLLSGCGLFSAENAPTLLRVIEKATELALEKSGKDLSELPVACLHEYLPASGVIRIECEIETKE